jgi:hypothetical protein
MNSLTTVKISSLTASPLLYSKDHKYYATKFTPLYLIEAHRRSLNWHCVTLIEVSLGLYEVTEF